MIIPPNIWGPNIWYIVHGISYKISDENFLKYKNEFIDLIKLLFTNLPCPECSKDASQKLDKTNFNNILSKNDMIKYLFDFHNYVNQKTNKSIFSYEEMKIYKNINLKNIYNNILIIYNNNTNIPKLMSENFKTKQAYPKIKNNLHLFLNII
tara:strand:+ start:267 stop:722 length:456 start_codon:yes stop_codon:yes gene_type:complete